MRTNVLCICVLVYVRGSVRMCMHPCIWAHEFPITGRIEKWLKKPGAPVQEGETLCIVSVFDKRYVLFSRGKSIVTLCIILLLTMPHTRTHARTHTHTHHLILVVCPKHTNTPPRFVEKFNPLQYFYQLQDVADDAPAWIKAKMSCERRSPTFWGVYEQVRVWVCIGACVRARVHVTNASVAVANGNLIVLIGAQFICALGNGTANGILIVSWCLLIRFNHHHHIRILGHGT